MTNILNEEQFFPQSRAKELFILYIFSQGFQGHELSFSFGA